MSVADERAVFHEAHMAWAAGDVARLLSLMTEDILHLVNVDGMAVPYAMSAVGKSDVADRLALLLDTFEVKAFDIENIVHDVEYSRSLVHGVYRHRRTGEMLDIKLRFRGWVRDGLLARIEETLDARYIEAFERMVFHLQTAAELATQ
jgi:ketosteroid isomerase-like protein